MNRSTLFWGGMLILVGILLLINYFVPFDIWDFFWPSLIIALGVWIIWSVVGQQRRPSEGEPAAIPLEGAHQAHIHMRHGAGRLQVGAGAGPEELLTGTFDGGLKYRADREGDALDVDMRVRERTPPQIVFLPWLSVRSSGYDWAINLNGEIPLSLELDTGASDTKLDLSDLLVTELRLKTGVSSTEALLPARAGHSRVRIEAGVAAVTVRVPEGVAARIRIASGLTGVSIDKGRFPRMAGAYQSPDYDRAANKVDIEVKTGLGSITIR